MFYRQQKQQRNHEQIQRELKEQQPKSKKVLLTTAELAIQSPVPRNKRKGVSSAAAQTVDCVEDQSNNALVRDIRFPPYFSWYFLC